jgi:hypothetical protein
MKIILFPVNEGCFGSRYGLKMKINQGDAIIYTANMLHSWDKNFPISPCKEYIQCYYMPDDFPIPDSLIANRPYRDMYREDVTIQPHGTMICFCVSIGDWSHTFKQIIELQMQRRKKNTTKKMEIDKDFNTLLQCQFFLALYEKTYTNDNHFHDIYCTIRVLHDQAFWNLKNSYIEPMRKKKIIIEMIPEDDIEDEL